MWPNPKVTTDLVTYTEEIINGNLHFLCSEIDQYDLSYFILKRADYRNYQIFLNRRYYLVTEYSRSWKFDFSCCVKKIEICLNL